MSVGDVGAERNVRAGANSDPRGEMRENVYWSFYNNIKLQYFIAKIVEFSMTKVPKIQQNNIDIFVKLWYF